jgi:hypothetical protein
VRFGEHSALEERSLRGHRAERTRAPAAVSEPTATEPTRRL